MVEIGCTIVRVVFGFLFGRVYGFEYLCVGTRGPSVRRVNYESSHPAASSRECNVRHGASSAV